MVTRKEPRLAVDLDEALGRCRLVCQAVPEGNLPLIVGIFSRKHFRFGCRHVRILSPRGSSDPAQSVDAMHNIIWSTNLGLTGKRSCMHFTR